MTRMIERWFPCQEVSANSNSGWGSGNSERNLFTWFAARPTAQAKAAVICSLLPWPDSAAEQKRLQNLVREAMTGRYAKRDELRREILRNNDENLQLLDPFFWPGNDPSGGGTSRTPFLCDGLFADCGSRHPTSHRLSIPRLDRRTEVALQLFVDPLGVQLTAIVVGSHCGAHGNRLQVRGGARGLLPHARWPSSVGLLVGCDIAMPGMRPSVPPRRVV